MIFGTLSGGCRWPGNHTRMSKFAIIMFYRSIGQSHACHMYVDRETHIYVLDVIVVILPGAMERRLVSISCYRKRKQNY